MKLKRQEVREASLNLKCAWNDTDKARFREELQTAEAELESLLSNEGAFLRKDVADLEFDKTYAGNNKTCLDLERVKQKYETISNDPGVRALISAVTLMEYDKDIRDRRRYMSTDEYHSFVDSNTREAHGQAARETYQIV